jgi:hypothetical protein
VARAVFYALNQAVCLGFCNRTIYGLYPGEEINKMESTFNMLKEAEITVTFRVQYSKTPLTPAKISGPPEDCYPAEGGEIEWEFTDENEFYQAVESAIGKEDE